jgi:hypothetical protein
MFTSLWRLLWLLPTDIPGHAIAQVVSRWLPTVAAQVLALVRSCGICGRQNGTGAVFFPQILWFPPPIIPPIAPHSSSFIIWVWYNKSYSDWHTKWPQSHPTQGKTDVPTSTDIFSILFHESLCTTICTCSIFSAFAEVDRSADCHQHSHSNNENISATRKPAFSSLLPYYMLFQALVRSLKEIFVAKHNILCSHIVLRVTFSNAKNNSQEQTNSWQWQHV